MLGSVDTLFGLKIVTSPEAYTVTPDAALARSPARARRRFASGKRKTLPLRRTPTAVRYGDCLIVHPDIYAKIRKELPQRGNFYDC